MLSWQQDKIIKQAKCTYSQLGNAFEKQVKKDYISPENELSNLISDRLKQITKLQILIK